jgi:hypothetical protein
MRRRLQGFLVFALWAMATPALAQEPTAAPEGQPQPEVEESAPAAPPEAAPEAPASKPAPREPPAGSAETAAAVTPGTEKAKPEPEAKPGKPFEDWNFFVSGYFRAPMALGISSRPGPDNRDGPAEMQISYGPNRTVDSNYYSFAYTRLQEQDWAEMFVHAKRKHVEAVVGWMGYWFQAAGFRNNDAGWVPGTAYLTLDTDIDVAGLKPNIALTGGAWWPKFGYFEKYDTYTLGQFRQLGEQLKLTVPVNADLKVTVWQGFGTGRDGSFNPVSPPPYQSTVGLDLLHYEHIQVAYKELFDVGLHFNHMWTRDPNLTQQVQQGRAYTQAREAKFTTFGGELNVRVPRAGRVWVSPSFTRIKNGWALGEGGTELLHSLSGEGYATNYMAWSGSPSNSSGTGSSFNLGFLYENTLSGVLGKEPSLPDVKLNVFGLLVDANLDLPENSVLTQDHIGQMKYGADLNVQALQWLGFMLRWDEVNYDLDHSGYVFSAISPRVTFSSHFLSGESLYIQYSRYRYGENMMLAAKWPWGLPLVPGSEILQGGPYSGHKPDMDVIRFQASVAF